MAKQNTSTKKEPLLPVSIEGGRSRSGSRVGRCASILLLTMPLIACSLILGTLYLLVYKMNISIRDISISGALADYEPTWQIILLLCTGAFASFVVTISRSIQIGVYHRRNNSAFRGLRLLNFVAAVTNILAYAGFIILAIYPIDGENKDYHMFGAYMYFGLMGLYCFFHIILLWKQRQYSMFSKIIMTIVPTASVICSVIFAIQQNEGYQYEWFAVALAALFIGLFVILFGTDRCDDELAEFFCCRKKGPTITDL
ncbi:hypothetical protein HJC23_000905 [Cyclotella cryptica]|uniref:CWH43-like N-terminal domain-containing protein n=1 Tax=Cyclotella cryptica TaxID=29204 RepID=A0ABD3PT55_9STRA|eukprot:CCRYP_011640-RA/>CCRYP_011640-RA protein AED:0.03 eAED:0.03 QI:145/1/1/1/1/1/2/259/255